MPKQQEQKNQSSLSPTTPAFPVPESIAGSVSTTIPCPPFQVMQGMSPEEVQGSATRDHNEVRCIPIGGVPEVRDNLPQRILQVKELLDLIYDQEDKNRDNNVIKVVEEAMKNTEEPPSPRDLANLVKSYSSLRNVKVHAASRLLDQVLRIAAKEEGKKRGPYERAIVNAEDGDRISRLRQEAAQLGESVDDVMHPVKTSDSANG